MPRSGSRTPYLLTAMARRKLQQADSALSMAIGHAMRAKPYMASAAPPHRNSLAYALQQMVNAHEVLYAALHAKRAAPITRLSPGDPTHASGMDRPKAANGD